MNERKELYSFIAFIIIIMVWTNYIDNSAKCTQLSIEANKRLNAVVDEMTMVYSFHLIPIFQRNMVKYLIFKHIIAAFMLAIKCYISRSINRAAFNCWWDPNQTEDHQKKSKHNCELMVLNRRGMRTFLSKNKNAVGVCVCVHLLHWNSFTEKVNRMVNPVRAWPSRNLKTILIQ